MFSYVNDGYHRFVYFHMMSAQRAYYLGFVLFVYWTGLPAMEAESFSADEEMAHLCRTIQIGDESLVASLLEKKIVWVNTYKGLTVFHYIAISGNGRFYYVIAKLSKENKIPVLVLNAVDPFGNTALVIALKKNHGDLAKRFILVGMNPFIHNKKGKDALDYLFTRSIINVVERLMILNALLANYPSKDWKEAVCKVAHAYLREGVKQTRVYEHTFLEACRWGCRSVVEHLLSEGMDLLVYNEQKETGAHLAAQVGHFSVIKALVKGCGTSNKLCAACDVNRNTPVHVAASRGYEECAKALLSKLDTWDKKEVLSKKNDEHETILLCAMKCQNVGIVSFIEWLTSEGARYEEKIGLSKDSIVLHFAARYSIKEVVAFFLKKGLSLKEKDGRGHTPLHVAATFGNIDAIELLVAEDDSLLRLVGNFGMTPLALAIFVGKNESIKALLRHLDGCDCMAILGGDKSALRYVVEKGDMDIVEIMVGKGANLLAIENGKKIIEYAPAEKKDCLQKMIEKKVRRYDEN